MEYVENNNIEHEMPPLTVDEQPQSAQKGSARKNQILRVLKSSKFRKIVILACVIIALIIGVNTYVSYNSAESVAERYLEAFIYQNVSKLDKLSAFNYYAYLLSDYDLDKEVFFEEASDYLDEDIYSWDDYMKAMKAYVDEELVDMYGEYTVTFEATRTKSMSINKMEEEMSYWLEMLEEETGFDRDTISAVKEIAVKVKIVGEDEIERETATVYVVQIGHSWKVLDIDL